MKTLDFSQLGRMPVTQDVLDYLQQSNIEMYAAIGNAFVAGYAANTPVLLSGMQKFTLTVHDGYFFYNGEIIAFLLSTIPLVPGGYEMAVIISETTTPLALPYYDGSTPAVKQVKTATLTTQSTGTAATTTQFAYAALQPIGAGLGVNNKESGFTTVSLTTFGTAGSLSYRKNYIANTLHIYGTIYITVSGLGPSPNPYYVAATLDVPYRPLNTVPFTCYYRYHNSNILDDTGKDYLRTINAEVATDGTVALGLLKAASDYTLTFNTIIPLD